MRRKRVAFIIIVAGIAVTIHQWRRNPLVAEMRAQHAAHR
jgi:hypothetical protein